MSVKIKIKWLTVMTSFAAAAIAFFSLNKDATAMSQRPVSPPKIEISLGKSGEILEKQYGLLVKVNSTAQSAELGGILQGGIKP